MPLLASVFSFSKMAIGETSLPVPEVVGIHISFFMRFLSNPTPTTSAYCCSFPVIAASSLAESSTLPPPTPITQSGLNRWD